MQENREVAFQRLVMQRKMVTEQNTKKQFKLFSMIADIDKI